MATLRVNEVSSHGTPRVGIPGALISDLPTRTGHGNVRSVSTEQVSGCVIVTGMPGAGKTTITSLLAHLMPRAAQVGGDAVNAMIGSGFVWFMGKPTEEALRQDELCNRNMCCLANNFIDFGFTVSDGHGPRGSLRAGLLHRADVTASSPARRPRSGNRSCKYRNAGRDPEDRFEFDGYERLQADMKREFGGIGWWLDTSAMTADQTAERLAGEMAGRTTPLLPGWNSWLRRLHDD